jgi:hypothetical protein
MPSKIDKSEIYERLKSIFPNYTFDMSDYTNTHCKILTICDRGHISKQNVKNLLNGHGCNICGNKISSQKQRSNFDDVLKKFRDIHGNKYDYSDFDYIKNRIGSTIKCPEHGNFKQSAWTHMKGHGCPSCSTNRKMVTSEFISKAIKIHNNKYDYSKTEYVNMRIPVLIICPKHGEFTQTPMAHLYRMSGCARCNQSIGEKIVEGYLIQNNIKYVPQKKFDNCRNISHLIFDFYLPDYNACIEFNGIQHYHPIDIFGGDDALKLNKLRDSIKVEYCKKNNINLIIIKQDKKHMNLSDVEYQIKNISNLLNIKESFILTFNKFKIKTM